LILIVYDIISSSQINVKTFPMQSNRLIYEPLSAAHAYLLADILTSQAVLAYIDPIGIPLSVDELASEYEARALGPPVAHPSDSWFNFAIRLRIEPYQAIGRLEATTYGNWGEVAYLLGEPWWGQGLGLEAMQWWHGYLKVHSGVTTWWAAVHPENARSIRLLLRLGYIEVDPKLAPSLGSYDEGDRCFCRSTVL
jgi:RimJ/RimL family protein N-acetyltransferase